MRINNCAGVYTRTLASVLVLTALAGCGGSDSSVTGSTSSAKLLPETVYGTTTTIVAEHSGHCLDVRGGPTAVQDGALIEQWGCSGEANQDWNLNSKGNGNYELIARSSNKCIEPINGATANNTYIQQATCDGSAKQLWNVRPKATAGRYEIVHAVAGRCLDVIGGPTATGEGVLTELWDCTGEANQSWALTMPQSSSNWVHCANEYGTCSFSGTRQVRYGANGQWATLTATNSIACNNNTFGDPVPGVPKTCEYSASSSGGGQPSVVSPYGQDASLYTLTFSDEFDGTTLDTSKWTPFANWFQSQTSGDDYARVQNYDNYEVSNGSLKVWPVAKPGDMDPSVHWAKDYRHFATNGKYQQRYGYFEIEAKLPYGKGVFPAFWLYNIDQAGQNFYPEIDIMEALPGGGPNCGWGDSNLNANNYVSTIWTGAPGAKLPELKFSHNPSLVQQYGEPNLSQNFYRYGAKWEPNKITFYFEGQEVGSRDVSMDASMFMLLSFQFATVDRTGTCGGGPADETTPTGQSNSFDVRYVRAWQFK